MRADDYSYYLTHLPDGTENATGSLFIDYNCAADFSDPLTVIYGHHMKTGKMFGSLKGYKEQSYYQEHPYMYLYTAQNNHRLDLLYGCVIGAGQWRDRAFMFSANIESLLAYAKHNTTFISDAVYQEGDNVIALSTCSYEFDDARYIVIGILRNEY
jgi:sortase B